MRCAGIDIFGWLDGIPLRDQENSGVDSSSPFVDEATSIYKGRPSKRQRLDPPTPPSSSEHRKRRPATKTQGPTTTTPSPIVAAMSGLSPSRRKRSHAECNDGDDKDETPSGADDAQVDDRTPRATRRLKPTRGLWSGSEHSLGTASSSSASASGYSSPHRQLGQLELRTQGFRIRELSALEDAGPAPLLAELVERLEGVSRGKAIVPPTVREAALQLPAARAQRFRWARDEYCVGVARDALGATPAPEVVLDVLDAAAECSANGHAEATWNTEVHQQILHMGLRRPERPRFGQLVNFFACTTASITAEYSRAPRSQKRVDFCVYIDPEQEDDHEVKDNDKDKPADSTPAAREAVAALRARLPAGVINHTDYRPLRERPVAWSIETKKTGEGWDSATLQLGIWQSAHWSFLRDLVAMQGHGTGTGTGTGTDADNDVDALPGFIPGLIIQGHDWHLVASTHDGDQTVLWQKLTLGSTSSTMGIYQIVCALQVLRQWTEQTYWPWLRAVIGASSRRGPSSS